MFSVELALVVVVGRDRRDLFVGEVAGCFADQLLLVCE